MTNSNSDTLPLLSGSVPGILDSSQPSRLLRTATAHLIFAAFDPHTARADFFPDISDLNIDSNSPLKHVNSDSVSGRRVVIERDAENHTCTWRFVPRAENESDVWGGEGPWPRVVVLDGQFVRMTQDQWDLYKLDPAYKCTVHTSPKFSTVTRLFQGTSPKPKRTPNPKLPFTPSPRANSRHNDTPTPKERRPTSPTFDTLHKKHKTSVDSDRMAIDEDICFIPHPSSPVSPYAYNAKNSRSDRHGDTSASESRPPKAKSNGKRRDPFLNSQSDSGEASQAKKFRSLSPDAVKREMEQKRADREKKRKAALDARFIARREALREVFWKGVGITHFDEEPLPWKGESRTSDTGAYDEESNSASSSSSDCDDETFRKMAQIEESKRKLAELEKDKPLWEESARRRQQKEVEEEFLRKQKREERKAAEFLREQMRAAHKQREDRWEQDRRERERQARIKEKRGRMFISPQLNGLRWNTRRALDRYLRIAAEFDATKFTAGGKPLSFALVPWPVHYSSYSVQDVDWDAVESFFQDIRRLLPQEEFRELVEKSHKRFHPDRWRSRGLLLSIRDETERDLLEVAGSTVAQAITPLWKGVTKRQ